ncbi:protein Wiz isoform X5 [Takifugu rubripes]|uniref:protein Wiz isoform X5 n=1 Tax=Takifugu rubripes TaxID=31033 RepID=UPI00114597B7|nr:protein Wiz-like isoform X5 [Takifugu rubripes]
MDLDTTLIPMCNLARPSDAVSPSTPQSSPGASSARTHCKSANSVVKKATISSLLPASTPLLSSKHKVMGIKCLNSNFTGVATTTSTKPLWAPQKNDAPLNLTLEVNPNKDIICQLCGAWFETRKGLSSHARAHLRHFGLECSESKGSPIDLLNQLIQTDNFKNNSSTLQPESLNELPGLSNTVCFSKQSPLLSSPSSSSSSFSSLLYKVTALEGKSTSKPYSSSALSLPGPPAKRQKSSCMQVFHLSSGDAMALPHSKPPKEIGCDCCGEYFENRKGLSSHARSHLRQMGITEWSVNGSPIDTLRDVMTRQGLSCSSSIKSFKKTSPSSPGPPKSLKASSSPQVSLLSRVSSTCIQPFSIPQPLAASKSISLHPISCSRGLTIKLKSEPAQVDVTVSGPVEKSHNFPCETHNWSSSASVFPLNLAMVSKPEPTKDICCELCGEYFENRKGLSSHARSHLRQMGITVWSVNGSPIDTLREIMMKKCEYESSLPNLGLKKERSRGFNSLSWESIEKTGSSQGLPTSSWQLSKFHKSPLRFLQSRLHKGFPKGLVSTSAAPSTGKVFRIISPVKRPESVDSDNSLPPRVKAISSHTHNFTVTRKSSPNKPGHQGRSLSDPSCELCGFFFENRKALASHARAHLRQFGVTEWSVNGSPIETLSAWIRTRPQKWSSSLAIRLAQPHCGKAVWDSFRNAEGDARSDHLARKHPRCTGLPVQAQVAHSELNVRLPRSFERRPLKHPTCPDGTESHRLTASMPRSGTVPALVPKPPTYPLVKMVGKYYTLKCRFCEVEFHGPLSVQEDWIRHLQQHILKMNYDKPADSKLKLPEEKLLTLEAATSTCSTTFTTTALRMTPGHMRLPPTIHSCEGITVAATDITKISEKHLASRVMSSVTV